jgi:two-component sensor histidine kinase
MPLTNPLPDVGGDNNAWGPKANAVMNELSTRVDSVSGTVSSLTTATSDDIADLQSQINVLSSELQVLIDNPPSSSWT